MVILVTKTFGNFVVVLPSAGLRSARFLKEADRSGRIAISFHFPNLEHVHVPVTFPRTSDFV